MLVGSENFTIMPKYHFCFYTFKVCFSYMPTFNFPNLQNIYYKTINIIYYYLLEIYKSYSQHIVFLLYLFLLYVYFYIIIYIRTFKNYNFNTNNIYLYK